MDTSNSEHIPPKWRCYSKTGLQHKTCEDVVYVRENDNMSFYGLADGQSGRKYCAMGGREVLARVADYVEAKGISTLKQRPTDEIQYELVRVIRESIRHLSENYNEPIGEFASTMIALAYNNGDYLLFHLGDGAVIGVDVDNQIRVISAGENGITAQYTYLTTSESAMNHIQVFKGSTNSLRRVVLVTDGAESIFHGRRIPLRSLDVILHDDQETIGNFFLDNNHSEDDATCLVLDF